MSTPTDASGPLRELKEVIASGSLSGPLQKQAETLLARIERPIRLGVMGLTGSGKSMLANLLLGTRVLPVGLRMPTVNLSYGPKRMAECTLVDGSKQTITFESLSDVLELKPVYVEAALPLPALQKLSIMEVVAGTNPTELKRAVSWATKRLDMALWCSAGTFSQQEQSIWGAAPERIQDHALLLLTKSDLPDAIVNREQRLEDARDAGENYFQKVLSIGTKAAIEAKHADGTVDKQALKKSGGMALISAILRDVEAGRSHAIDQVHVFLHQVDFTSVETHPAEAAVEPAKPVEVVEKDTPPAPKPEQSESPAAHHEAEAEETPQATTLAPGSRPALEQAVEQLAEEGKLMTEAVAEGSMGDAEIVANCLDTVTWLSEYLSGGGENGDPIYAGKCEAATDAADLVQLIRLESGDNVATDTLSVLIQLKQDMQMSLAA